MLDHKLRVYKDQMLRPLACRLRSISPNIITLVALVVGVAAAGAAATHWYSLALGLWLANRVLDGLDGIVARGWGRQNDFGGYLDIVADFVVYAGLPIGLYWGDPSAANALMTILLLACFYVNAVSWLYLSAILEKRSLGANIRGEFTTVTMPAGLVGGTETIIFYCAFLLWPEYLPWLFGVMAGMVVVGVGQRLWWAHRNLRHGSTRTTMGITNSVQ